MSSLPVKRLTPGAAKARVLKLTTPLSLWGGLDLETGAICDATHPQRGLNMKGRILAMPAARGSSSSSSALVEAARRGTAPAALILGAPDPVLIIGSLVAAELYGVEIPILLIARDQWDDLLDDAEAEIHRDEQEIRW